MAASEAKPREAFVTLCTNDNYLVGALVLAQSIRLQGSTRNIVCVTTSEFASRQRATLSNVFNEIVEVNPLDSKDAQHLGLLGRPELGITITKLACWTLTQYNKCVYLDADTLVIQNVDDLFDRPSFAAAPDVGWPDCFNSGVFVYAPSMQTYTGLLECMKTQGSFDGGDQGVLNTYFSSWSTDDASHRLPFGYNMTSNTSYGYAPALEHYRRTVKIVHFIGKVKPWHLSRSSSSHPLHAYIDAWHDVKDNFDRFGTLKGYQSAGPAERFHLPYVAAMRFEQDSSAPAGHGAPAGPGWDSGGAAAGTSGSGEATNNEQSFDLIKSLLDVALREDNDGSGEF
eukprot:m.367186 g.367186  ORF g.367186 m.367186 type:complete len:341 (-) comp20826_c0_seq1:298-1320(-)